MLTDGSDRQAKDALTRLERYRAAISATQNPNFVSQLPTRIYLILSEDEWKWIKDVSLPQPFVVGIYNPTPWQNFLAISSVDDKKSDGQVTLHEYTHLLFRSRQLVWPLWMKEGFAELLATVDLNAERAIFGEPNRLAVLYLRRKGLIPMEALFSFDPSSNSLGDAEFMTRFYAQSWAVSHYLMFGLPPDKSRAFEQFRADVARGTPTAQALQKHLSLSPDQLSKVIKDHLHSGDYRTLGFRLPPEVKEIATARERPAAPGEAEAWLGDWALESQEPNAALQRYGASLQEAPDNFYGLLGQGSALAQLKEYDRALPLLRQAVEMNPQSGWAQLALGVCLLQTDPTGSETVTPAPTVTEAIAALKRATELMPNHSPAYGSLGLAYQSTGNNKAEATAAWSKALTLDPASRQVVYLPGSKSVVPQNTLETIRTIAPYFTNQVTNQATNRAAD